jgi:geranylgeranyl pyrophosphate synthase
MSALFKSTALLKGALSFKPELYISKVLKVAVLLLDAAYKKPGVQAHEMARRAMKALERVPPSPARQELAALIDMVVEREQ